jgi:hypothetical protein
MACTIGVFGGCHVEGFKTGSRYAFASRLNALFAESGQEADVFAVPYVRYRDAPRVVRMSASRGADIIVLQIGNFEASWAPFVSSLRRKRIAQVSGLSALLARASGSSSGSVAPLSEAQAHEEFRHARAYFLRHSVKWMIDTLFGGLLVDYASMQREMRECLDAIRGGFSGAVIVLTPFPHMDLANRRHRRRAGMLLTQECLKREIVVIDTFPILGAPWYFLPDGAHLNVQGHEALARALMNAIAAHRRVAAA